MPADLSQLIEVSARIGADPLLVQGPGGNTSLKVDDEIWVKASGTWLAEAGDRPIFAGLNLSQARSRLAENMDADLSGARIAGAEDLRPSIETALHVLMPHRAVLHAHAVGAMTVSVLADGEARARRALAELDWAWIPYHRPGAPLAEAIARVLQGTVADVLILQNHGVVVGADTPAAAERRLAAVEARLAFPVRDLGALPPDGAREEPGFEALASLSGLALDAAAREIVTRTPLIPDQVVFLGGAIPLVGRDETLAAASDRVERASGVAPAVLLKPGAGMFGRRGRSAAADSVVGAIYEIARRIPDDATVQGLPEGAIAALLGWDAESYRIALAQTRTV